MWNLKKNDTNEFTKQKQIHKEINLWLPKGKTGRRVKLGVWDKQTRTTVF